MDLFQRDKKVKTTSRFPVSKRLRVYLEPNLHFCTFVMSIMNQQENDVMELN